MDHIRQKKQDVAGMSANGYRANVRQRLDGVVSIQCSRYRNTVVRKSSEQVTLRKNLQGSVVRVILFQKNVQGQTVNRFWLISVILMGKPSLVFTEKLITNFAVVDEKRLVTAHFLNGLADKGRQDQISKNRVSVLVGIHVMLERVVGLFPVFVGFGGVIN